MGFFPLPLHFRVENLYPCKESNKDIKNFMITYRMLQKWFLVIFMHHNFEDARK